jgi:mono/diheme cytochrome c family protein
MSPRAIVPFLALVLGSATLMLNAQKVKKTNLVPTSASSGQQMFNEYCAVCHGTDGKGKGPASGAMKAAPTNLTMLATNNGGKFPDNKVYGAIRGDAETPAHGSKDMPVWGTVFQEMSHGNAAEVQLRISNLTQYIGGLQAK